MYILASKSPRRQELLKKIITNFEIVISNIDEHAIKDDPYNLPLTLSLVKAQDVFKSYPNDTIIASDTLVIFNNIVFGKPQDEKDAFNMLKTLSNKTHDVVTGFTILSKDRCISKKVITKVTFNNLSDETINAYIATKSPFDKAGGYGIQDTAFNLVKSIEGSYDNVMGLPTEELKKYL